MTARTSREQDGKALVTVLVPVRNEERSISACLTAILAQDYPALQVVVVDGESTDATPEIVTRFGQRDARVEMLSVPPGSIPASLNAGLVAARGTWLVRVDGHSAIPPEYVRLAVDRLREGRWGGVGGRKDGYGDTAAGRAIAAALGSRFGVGNSLYHHGTRAAEVDHVPFGAYPVALARRLGGWDERLVANEDYEFDYRVRQAGHALLFDPELAIRWESRQTLRDLLRQYYRYGRGKADVAVLHPASLKPRHLAPPAFVAYAASAAAMSVARPKAAAGMLAPYVGGLLVASAAATRRLDRRRDAALVPGAFVCMHLGWGAGFLVRAPRAIGLRRVARVAGPSGGQPREASAA